MAAKKPTKRAPKVVLISPARKPVRPAPRARNPIKRTVRRAAVAFPFEVQTMNKATKRWRVVSGFKLRGEAMQYAKALHAAQPAQMLRVVDVRK